jgi:hypothetical protein
VTSRPYVQAIAGLGGFFVEGNDRFCRLVGCTNHQDLMEMSIFSLIADQDMATALDRLTKWLMEQQPPDPNLPQQQAESNKSTLTLRSNVMAPPLLLGSSAHESAQHVTYQLNFSPIWEPGPTLQLDSSLSSNKNNNGIVSSTLHYLSVSLLPRQQVSPHQRTVSPSYGVASPLLVPAPFPSLHSYSENNPTTSSPSYDDASSSFSTSSGSSTPPLSCGNSYNFGPG